MKKKLLILENSVDVTGALKSIVRTAYDLRPFFDFLFVVPTNSRGRAWIRGKGFTNMYELPAREISRRITSWVIYLPYLFVNALRLRTLIRQEKVDLMHTNDIYNLIPVALRWLGTPIPYVCHIRFQPDRFPPWLFGLWLRLHLRYAHRVIAVSNSVLSGLPPHPKLTMVYNELPVEELLPEAPPKRGTGPPLFLYMANYIPGKGHDLALQAFARIHRQLPEWQLRFVGGDLGMEKNRVYQQNLIKQAEALGLSEKIIWRGFTDSVEQEYKEADIVLNFSESESFSMTCVEALFFGRPLIASNSGGPAEIIVHKKTGLLVENRNVAAMAEAMETLAKNPEWQQTLALAGKQDVRTRFSVQQTSLKLKALYDAALERA